MNYTKFATGFLFSIFAAFCFSSFAAGTCRVATFNVENYLDQPTETRPHVKSAESRAKIRESIRVLNPDVLALEEMGTTNALLELRASLKSDGLDFPFWEHVSGGDTNIHLAVLSRLPIITHQPAHERTVSARWPAIPRGARVCGGGNRGRDELQLHAHRHAFEIAPARAQCRRSPGAPRGGESSARHRG